MRNAQALRACPVRDGARPAFPGHLTSALGWLQGLPRTTHRREGLGRPRSAGRGSYAAGRWRPAPLPLPCRGGAGGPAPGHGRVRMGTSALPGEQAWAAWPAPAGHPHLLKCCPLVGGGASPQTHDLQTRPSEEARRSCDHVTPRPAPTTAGRTGVTARRLRPPPSRPGLGTPDSVSSHWPPEVPAPQPGACPARPHLLSPSPPAARLSCCLGRLLPRPMPRPAPQPLGLWSFVAAAPGEYRLL